MFWSQYHSTLYCVLVVLCLTAEAHRIGPYLNRSTSSLDNRGIAHNGISTLHTTCILSLYVDCNSTIKNTCTCSALYNNYNSYSVSVLFELSFPSLTGKILR